MKTFENFNKDWDDVLKKATWTQKKISENVWEMDFENIKLAIENGADIEYCGTLGWAVRMINYKVAKFLLENSADVNYSGKNPFSKDWSIIASLILDYDNAKQKFDLSEYLKVAKMLIDYDADLSQNNFQDNNALKLLFPVLDNNHQRLFPSNTKGGEKLRNDIIEYFISYVIKNHQFEKYKDYLDYFKPYIDSSEDEIIKKYKKTIDFNL